MSLQSPFGSDINAQLMALQGGMGQQIPQRDPGDMGSREQFMRMLGETRDAEQRAYQRQMETEERGFGRQMEMMKASTQQQMATQQNQAYLNQQAQERALAKMQQYEAEEESINTAMITADAAKRQELLDRKTKLLQDKNNLQSAITAAESRVAGLDQQAKIATGGMIREFQTAYDGLNAQEQDGIGKGTTLDWTNMLRNRTAAARNAAFGSSLSPEGSGYAGSWLGGGYSDLHFALQDQNFANAFAAFADKNALEAMGATAREGGIFGATGRGIERATRGIGGLFDYIPEVPGAKTISSSASGKTATIADRIKAAQEVVDRQTGRAGLLFDVVGTELSHQLGMSDPTKLRGLFNDLEMYKVALAQGNQQGADLIRERLKQTITDVGGQTLGQSGLLRFFEAAASSFEKVKDEKGKESPRFGAATGAGAADDIINAMGAGMAKEFRTLADTLGSVYKSGEIQTAAQYKALIDGINAATGVSTKEGATGAPVVTLDEKTLEQLVGGLVPGYARTTTGATGFLKPEQVQKVKELQAILADISGERRGIASTQKQIMEFLADPANAQFLSSDAQAFMDLMASRAAAQAGERTRAKLRPRGGAGLPPPIARPTL